MKLKEKTLELNNLLKYNVKLDMGEDVFKQMDAEALTFKKSLERNNFYTSGPIIFTYNPYYKSENVEIMTTLGNKLNIISNESENYTFEEHFKITTNYFYRHIDMSESIPYTEIYNNICSEKNLRVENIYHVILDYYGEQMLDLYYCVKEV